MACVSRASNAFLSASSFSIFSIMLLTRVGSEISSAKPGLRMEVGTTQEGNVYKRGHEKGQEGTLLYT